MAPVMEFLSMRLKAGQSAINDPSTNEAKIMTEAQKYIKDFGGNSFVKTAVRVEDPDLVQVFVVWDSMDEHKKFTAQPGYKEFAGKIFSAGENGSASLQFYDISPVPTEALNSPVTEILQVYLPTAEATESKQSEFEDSAKSFFKAIEPVCGGRLNVQTSGWSVGEIDTDKVDGGKAKVYMALIGWQSIAAHMEVRETKEFREHSAIFANVKVEMFHVK